MSVGRICQREVNTARLDESVDAAARRMKERSVGTLLVLNSESEPVGILTDRDIVTRVVAEGRNAHSTRIRDVMTSRPKTIIEETPIESAIAMMRSGGFRRLPVVDQAGKLVGIVTLDDILALFAEEFVDVGLLLDKEAPRAPR
jgi:CBS domain-containing protein